MDDIIQKIKDVLETEIRPMLQADGGDISFERYDEGIVYVKLRGACSGCPGAVMTLKMGVEKRLKAAVFEVKGVVAI